eukprot:snap_masked-scaffold_54-processed-gene-1.70-mRNA-1 protein AED:1.00 eAED:1.00 QI:0/-1/0/0/-1/1/1/0/177
MTTHNRTSPNILEATIWTFCPCFSESLYKYFPYFSSRQESEGNTRTSAASTSSSTSNPYFPLCRQTSTREPSTEDPPLTKNDAQQNVHNLTKRNSGDIKADKLTDLPSADKLGVFNEDDECFVCYEEFTPESPEALSLCGCGSNRHRYHLHCLTIWRTKSQRTTCPVCDQEIFFQAK